MPGFDQTTELSAWSKLQEHHQKEGKNLVLKEQFERDPERFARFSRIFKNNADKSETLFDFSKNFLTGTTLNLLVDLAKEAKLPELREAMFKGEKINFTENRAVYHVALRNVKDEEMKVDGKSVVGEVNSVLEHMKDFSDQVRSGKWTGYTGKPIRSIVNIGIGGSDLYVTPFPPPIVLWVPRSDANAHRMPPPRTGDPLWSPKLSSRMEREIWRYTTFPTSTARISPKL